MFERSLSSCDIRTRAMEGDTVSAASAPVRPQLHKSMSAGNCLVEKKRGFMPSDCHDPQKRQFLIELSQQFWQKKTNEPLNSKRIDLQKIFTPATDAEEILPKNRKLYASSAFYSPTLHPTVEDQVELARRISHSLSDISNHQSKGQSMYVNRKKRSVKWVHEGSGKATTMDAGATTTTTQAYDLEEEESKENTTTYNNNNNNSNNNSNNNTNVATQPMTKVPLKLLMNPRGQVRDLNSMRETLNTETGLLSPDRCAELVSALNMQKGKGAELFAKRRKKAEKWVVDETNAATQSPSGLADGHQYQAKSPTSPSLLPAYSDAGKHRVQLNMHQEQLLEKYARPGLKVVKTPWAAALETGNASSAFVEEQRGSPHYQRLTPSRSPAPPLQYADHRATSPFVGGGDGVDGGGVGDPSSHKLPSSIYHQAPVKGSTAAYNAQRDLAYRPSIPQGWKAPSVSLPRDLYIPKEIPLESYAPPPTTGPLSPPTKAGAYMMPPMGAMAGAAFDVDAPPYGVNGAHYSPSPPKPLARFPVGRGGGGGGGTAVGGFCTVSPTPPRQVYLPPDSYQKVAPVRNATPQLGFNPSPLPYDKLAKFENVSPPEVGSPVGAFSPYRGQLLGVAGGRVRNISPAPYGARPTSAGSQTFPTSAATPSGGTPASSRPPSQQYGGYDVAAHGANFNSAPRGWNGGAHAPAAFPASCGAGYRNAKPIAAMAMAALPYTDF